MKECILTIHLIDTHSLAPSLNPSGEQASPPLIRSSRACSLLLGRGKNQNLISVLFILRTWFLVSVIRGFAWGFALTGSIMNMG